MSNKHILPKTLKKIKRILAVVMLPIFLTQMISINFLFLATPNVYAAHESAPTESSIQSAATEETPAQNLDLGTENSVTIGTNSVAASIEKPVATGEVTIVAPKHLWSTDGDKSTTSEAVELGKTYIAPQNDQVTVTFTKLPENSGTLSIEEVKLTDEQVKSLGALSDKAYDITSSMENGTFKYELTLPKPKNEKNVQIRFAEDVKGLEKAEVVAEADTKTTTDSIKTSLDHFTVFVATNSSLSNITITSSAGHGGTISPEGSTIMVPATSLMYFIQPDPGFDVSEILVDGVSVGALTSYEFTDVNTDHTISANFASIASADTVPPVISELSFANRTGVVNGNTIDINIGGITDSDLAVPGNITVSEPSTLQIMTPLTLAPKSLPNTNNLFSFVDFMGFPLNAAQIQQAFALSGNFVGTTGKLTDASGNVTDVIINVTYFVTVDSIAPVITMNGSTPLNIALGSTYVDAGATALDNVDGDMTANIVTVNSVDTNTIGIYTVTYDVVDNAGNQATQVVRTVNVTDQTVPTAPPVITAFSYAGQSGTVNSSGDTVDISISDPVKLNLELGNIAVSSNSTLQIEFPPLPSGSLPPIALNSGDNQKSLTSIFGFPNAIVAENLISTASTYPNGTIPVVGTLTDSFNQVTNISINITVDAVYPLINEMTFAGKTGIVSNGNNVDLNLNGVSDSDLAGIGSISVSEGSLLNITSPLPTGDIQLVSGVNGLGTSDIFGFTVTAMELKQTAVNFPNGIIRVTGSLTDTVGNVTNVTINITVDVAAPTITMNGLSPIDVEYGGVYVDAGATAFDAVDGDLTANIVTNNTVNTNALGQYTVTYNVTDNNGNAAEQVTRIVNVVPKSLVITANNNSKTYGDQITFNGTEFSTNGLINGDTVTSVSLASTGAVANAGVGSYSIDASSAVGTGLDNYTISYVSGTLTVSSKTISVVADAKSKTFGDADPELTFTSDPLVNGDSFSGALTRNAGEDVGTYAITQGTLAAGLNYNLSFVDSALTINKAVSVTSVTCSSTATYTGIAIETCNAVATGAGGLSQILGVSYVSNIDAGITTASADFAGDLNHEASFNSAAFEITKASLSVVADNQTKQVNDLDPNFTFSILGFVNGEDSSVIDTMPTCNVSVAHSIAGNYPIVCSGGTDNNYDFTYANGTLTVFDIDAPVISGTPSDMTVEATDSNGAAVNYALPTANDANDGQVVVTCVPSSGSVFSLGTTTVTCSATDSSNNTSTNSFAITVQDTTAPVIALLGSNPVNVQIGSVYNDAGATASDLVDGNLTANIVAANPVDINTLGIYVITYDVVDAHSNTAVQVTRTVNVIDKVADTIAPVITLIGGNVKMKERKKYVEKGATWTDNIDGSGVVTNITSNLNTRKPGTYTITYSYTDAAGNTGFAYRFVTVTNVKKDDDDDNNKKKPKNNFLADRRNIFVESGDDEGQDQGTSDQDSNSKGSVEGVQTTKEENLEKKDKDNDESSSKLPWAIGIIGLSALAWLVYGFVAKKNAN